MKKIILIVIGILLIGGIAIYAIDESQNKDVTSVENSQSHQTLSKQTSNHLDQARSTALSRVSGTVKCEYEDEEYVFLIENDNTLSQVEVDKVSGLIDDIDTVTYKNEITYDKVQSIALTKVNGTIKEVGIDDDEYDFTIEKDNILYEIEIDSYNGNIKKVEQENIIS